MWEWARQFKDVFQSPEVGPNAETHLGWKENVWGTERWDRWDRQRPHRKDLKCHDKDFGLFLKEQQSNK